MRSGAIDPIQTWTDSNGIGKLLLHWKAHPVYSQQENYLENIVKKR